MWRAARVAAASTLRARRAPARLFSSSAPSGEVARRGQHLLDALRIVHAYAVERYDASVDVAVVLNVDAKRSDERVRGSAVLPHGTGKNTRVAVFARGELAEEARQAGADVRELCSNPLPRAPEREKSVLAADTPLLSHPQVVGAEELIGGLLSTQLSRVERQHVDDMRADIEEVRTVDQLLVQAVIRNVVAAVSARW